MRRGKDQKRRPLAPASINRELAFLRRVFNVAIADEKIETSPVRPGFFTRENNQRVRYLSDDEEQRLRKAIGEEHWPPVAVALHTGLRRAEQFGLRWEHADFQVGVLTIPRSKSGKARHVPMNDTVRETLRALPSRLKSEWVFPSSTGETPVDAQNFYNRVFIPALKRAGIERFTWHSLRHTFASRLVMAGVALRTVQEPSRRGLGQRPTSGRYDNFRQLSLLVRQAKPERGGRDVIAISETFRRSPAGTQSRPAKVGHQPVPSVALWRSDPRCEAYTRSVQAA